MATYELYEGTLFIGQTPDHGYMERWVNGGTPYRPERWARDQDGCTSHPMPRAMLCDAHCEHGGVCSLPKDHDGWHDASGYCQWADAATISKEEADDRMRINLAGKGVPGAIADILAEWT